MATLNNDQHYEAGKAMQEITDRLYTLQQLAGLPQEWVQEKATELQHDFQEKTGIDLGEF